MDYSVSINLAVPAAIAMFVALGAIMVAIILAGAWLISTDTTAD